MAAYVEFIGISGVGKTTTYNRLKAEIKLSSPFTVPEFSQKNRSFSNTFKDYLRTILKPNKNRIKCNDWEVLNRFFEENPVLTDLYWESFFANGKGEGKDVRFSTILYILKIFEKVQKTIESPLNQLFIIDEGLIHNLNYFLNPETASEPDFQIKRIFDLLQLPRGVVYFHGDISTVTKRTMERRKLNLRDKNLTPEELVQSRLKSLFEKKKVIASLEQRGIPILYLNCEESIPVKTQRIVSFLEEIVD